MIEIEGFIGILIVFFFTIINFIIIRYYQNYTFIYSRMLTTILGIKNDKKKHNKQLQELNTFTIIATCISSIEILFTIFLIVWPEFIFLLLSGDINVANNQFTFEKVAALSLIRLWGSFFLTINGLYIIINVNSLWMFFPSKKSSSSLLLSSSPLQNSNIDKMLSQYSNTNKNYNTIKKKNNNNDNNSSNNNITYTFNQNNILVNNLYKTTKNNKETNNDHIVSHIFLSLLIIKKIYYILGLIFGVIMTFLEISSTSNNTVTVLLLNPAYITTMIFSIIIHLTLAIFYRYFTLTYFNVYNKLSKKDVLTNIYSTNNGNNNNNYENNDNNNNDNDNDDDEVTQQIVSEEIINFLIYL